MRKIPMVLVLLVVGIVALGFYLDWFHFTTTSDPESGKVKSTLEIDQNKIKADAEKAKQKLSGAPTTAATKASPQ